MSTAIPSSRVIQKGVATAPLPAGVGASAGGLEAMLPMFARTRRTGRIAYVVAQHMMHNGQSDLVARLIGRESALPVVLGRRHMRLQADTVYLIPSGKDGRVREGFLELSDPSPRKHLDPVGQRTLPIDRRNTARKRDRDRPLRGWIGRNHRLQGN
ncbi:MAG: chemotaxis protein CheB [Candidatus Solibacter sp.]